MTTIILDATTRAAVRDATSQQAQLEALIAPWSAGQVTLRYYSAADALLVTCTHAAWAINTSTTPRQVAVGALVSESGRVAGPTAASYVIAAVPGGADILRADVSLAANVGTATGRVNLAPQTGGAGLVVTADAGLPAAPTPTWASGAAVNEWVEITGTSGAGGAAVDAFSGWALVGTKVVIACAGGHGSGHDNRVVSCDLSANSPSWTTLMAASASGTNDAAYYSDGKPCSRHTYHSIHAITGNKVLLGGVRFTYNGAATFGNIDAFDLNTNTWDGVVAGSPGTSGSGYTDQNPAGAYLAGQDGDGNLWWWNYNTGAAAKYTVSTDTWTSPSITGAVSPSVRYPWAWDSSRSQFLGLAWADGEGAGTDLRAVRQSGTTQAAVSFNASSALTDLTADAPEYAAMGYEPTLDKFLFYEGYSTRAGRVYAITPNGTTTWDVSVLTTTGTPSATFGTKGSNHTGVQNRFSYVTVGGVSGFVMLPQASSNLWFLRTA